MRLSQDFAPFKEPAFLLALTIVCVGLAAGGAVLKYLAG
jgi:hypothetical protein